MFDAVKSKLFPQIMEALANFFGLGSDATETEIHNALDGQLPLKEQIEAAKNAAIEATAADMKDVKDRLSALEAEHESMKAENTAKDTRIAELQTQIADHEKAVSEAKTASDAMKAQHEKEIKVLAGQVSALKAGRTVEQDLGGDEHDAVANAPKDGVMTMKSTELQALVKKAASN